MVLLPVEWLSFWFGAGLLCVVLIETLRGRVRPGQARGAAFLILLVLGAAALPPSSLRDWSPLAFIAAGYWAPAMLVVEQPDNRFAGWLMSTERRIGGWTSGVPRWLAHACDICYLLCYPLVPAAYVALTFAAPREQRQQFWLIVVGAAFACYATLPWLVSLPPRRTGGAPRVDRHVSGFNVAVLNRVSHGFNTFPSGHAAVSTAVAAACLDVPWAAAASAIIATGVAIGAVIGRHHYVVDVLLGIGVGVASALVVRAFSL